MGDIRVDSLWFVGVFGLSGTDYDWFWKHELVSALVLLPRSFQ